MNSTIDITYGSTSDHTVTKSRPRTLYVAPTASLRVSYDMLRIRERLIPRSWRRRALARCLEYCARTAGDSASGSFAGKWFVELPCLVGQRSEASRTLAPSLEGMEAWKWEDEEEGIRYVGARSHTWDTAFSMLALLEDRPIAEQFPGPLRRAYAFLRDDQLTAEVSKIP